MTQSDQNSDGEAPQGDDNSITVSFDVTRADWEAFIARYRNNVAANGKRKTPTKKSFLIFVFYAFLIGIFIFFLLQPGVVRWIVVGAYALIAAWIPWKWHRLSQSAVSRIVDKMIQNSGPDVLFRTLTITISTEGVLTDRGSVTQLLRWSGVKSIEEEQSENDYAVYINKGPANFTRIPRRAFASDEAMREFVECAKSWWQQQQQSAVSNPSA